MWRLREAGRGRRRARVVGAWAPRAGCGGGGEVERDHTEAVSLIGKAAEAILCLIGKIRKPRAQ